MCDFSIDHLLYHLVNHEKPFSKIHLKYLSYCLLLFMDKDFWKIIFSKFFSSYLYNKNFHYSFKRDFQKESTFEKLGNLRKFLYNELDLFFLVNTNDIFLASLFIIE